MTVDIHTIKIGDRVRAEREAPSEGSWPRYDGKVGTVTRINHECNEIGVILGGPILRPERHTSDGQVWFTPSELVLIRARD